MYRLVLALEFSMGSTHVDNNRFPVAIAAVSHPFPSRTRQLSPPAPMVLGGRPPGRVGRRRISHAEHPRLRPGVFAVSGTPTRSIRAHGRTSRTTRASPTTAPAGPRRRHPVRPARANGGALDARRARAQARSAGVAHGRPARGRRPDGSAWDRRSVATASAGRRPQPVHRWARPSRTTGGRPSDARPTADQRTGDPPDSDRRSDRSADRRATGSATRGSGAAGPPTDWADDAGPAASERRAGAGHRPAEPTAPIGATGPGHLDR